jgi:hypothetical protein
MPFLEDRAVAHGFSQMVDAKVDDFLEQLTLDEKVALTAGTTRSPASQGNPISMN